MKLFKNLLFITKYKKLRKLEFKRWIFIAIYIVVYFSIEAFAAKKNIPFAIWDSVLTASLILLVFIFGNLFCGWFCFLSKFQDVVAIIGRFIFRKKYNNLISQNVRNKLKWIKYIFFTLTLGIPLLFRSYSTFISLFGIGLYLGLFFSLIESNAYCKYFCFLGACFNLAKLRNKRKLIRNSEKCVDCNICSEICLQDCNPAKIENSINRNLWCTSCYRCKAVCPANAISITT